MTWCGTNADIMDYGSFLNSGYIGLAIQKRKGNAKRIMK